MEEKTEKVKENNSVMKRPTDLIDMNNVMAKVDKAAQSEATVMCKLCQAELTNRPELLVEHCRVDHRLRQGLPGQPRGKSLKHELWWMGSNQPLVFASLDTVWTRQSGDPAPAG